MLGKDSVTPARLAEPDRWHPPNPCGGWQTFLRRISWQPSCVVSCLPEAVVSRMVRQFEGCGAWSCWRLAMREQGLTGQSVLVGWLAPVTLAFLAAEQARAQELARARKPEWLRPLAGGWRMPGRRKLERRPAV